MRRISGLLTLLLAATPAAAGDDEGSKAVDLELLEFLGFEEEEEWETFFDQLPQAGAGELPVPPVAMERVDEAD